MEPSAVNTESGHDRFIRFGGAICLVGLVLHVLVNEGLKVMPPEAPAPEELQAYLASQASTWAVIHGLRNLALPCLVFFAAAMFLRTCCLRSPAPTGWGIVGLFGSAMQVIQAFLTNALESLLLLDSDLFAGDTRPFEIVFWITRFLFTAEIATWAVFIGGFSMAGRASKTLPGWIVALGAACAVAGLLGGAFVVPAFTGSRAAVLLDVAALTGLAWFACAATYLIVRGGRTGSTPA